MKFSISDQPVDFFPIYLTEKIIIAFIIHTNIYHILLSVLTNINDGKRKKAL